MKLPLPQNAKTIKRLRNVRNWRKKENVERKKSGRNAKRLVKNVEVIQHAIIAMIESSSFKVSFLNCKFSKFYCHGCAIVNWKQINQKR